MPEQPNPARTVQGDLYRTVQDSRRRLWVSETALMDLIGNSKASLHRPNRLALLEPVTRGDLLGVYGGELLSQFAPETPEEATVGRVADAWRAYVFPLHGGEIYD